MEIREIKTKISYANFGDMITISEWIAGRTNKRKYLKWMKSHKNCQSLKHTFSDEEILKYCDYIETLKEFDVESIKIGKPNIWIVDKFLHVRTLKPNNNDELLNNKRFEFDLIGRPLQKSNACYIQNTNKLLQSIKTYSSFGEYLEHIMQNPENNHIWVSYMKTRLILDDKPYDQNTYFDIFEFVSSYQNDPIIIKWTQHCALACVAKDLYNN